MRRAANGWPVHPFLFALSPILFLFAYNAARLPLSPSELVIPALIALAGTLLLWLLLSLILRDRVKAGIITSAFVLFFFLHGRVLSLLRLRAGEPEFSLPFWGILLVVIALLVIRARRPLQRLNGILNIIAATILLTNVVLGLPGYLSSLSHRRRDERRTKNEERRTMTDYPDIYYIILDSYARDDVLKDDYGLDNTPFLDFLTTHGFQVARRSRTNYIHTYPSLAAALNFEYLDSLARKYAGKTRELTPFTDMIANNRVVEILRQHGYSTLVVSSGDPGIALANSETVLPLRGNLTEFQNLVLNSTPLPVMFELVGRNSFYDQRRGQILHALRSLTPGAQVRHPVFVLAHIICPHPPYVFGPNGESINPRGARVFTADDGFQVTGDRQQQVKGFADQTRFLNRRVEETVNRILAESPSSPVIILQADHGPDVDLDWGNPQPGPLAERFAILNAVCIPPSAIQPQRTGVWPYAPCSTDSESAQSAKSADSSPASSLGGLGGESSLYDSITPVNTFRVVLNRLFGTELPLLPDRSYYSGAQASYEFVDANDSGFFARLRERAGLAAGVNVVAFPRAAGAELSPKNYCRKLLALKYGWVRPALRRSYIRAKAEELSAEQAFEMYRRHVQSGDLPELGNEYEVYAGAGPDGNPVAALFFFTKGR